MVKAILIRVSTIIYIIKQTLAKDFAFSNSNMSISDGNQIISYIGTLAVFALHMPWKSNSFSI